MKMQDTFFLKKNTCSVNMKNSRNSEKRILSLELTLEKYSYVNFRKRSCLFD